MLLLKTLAMHEEVRSRLDRGELTIQVRLQQLDELLLPLDAMVNRLALSVLLAAFVAGTSLVMVFYHPGADASWLRWFFASGLVAIIVLGVWLAVAIHHSGRR